MTLQHAEVIMISRMPIKPKVFMLNLGANKN